MTHLRIARRIVGEAASAEDVCQQAYLKALTAEDRIREPQRLTGWLTRVIVNESLDALRRHKQQVKASHVLGQTVLRDTNTADPHAGSDNREYLATYLDRLDESVRTIVVMRTMKGMTGNEVKRALGCSAALVSRRLHQGLEQLRQWMIEDRRGKDE